MENKRVGNGAQEFACLREARQGRFCDPRALCVGVRETMCRIAVEAEMRADLFNEFNREPLHGVHVGLLLLRGVEVKRANRLNEQTRSSLLPDGCHLSPTAFYLPKAFPFLPRRLE